MDNEAPSRPQPHTMYIALQTERASRQVRDSLASAMRARFPNAPLTITWDAPPKDAKRDAACVWIAVSGYRPQVWEAIYERLQLLACEVHIESIAVDPTFGLAMFNYAVTQPKNTTFLEVMRQMRMHNGNQLHEHARTAVVGYRRSALQRELVDQHLAAYADAEARRSMWSEIDRLVELAVEEALTEERIAAADR